MGQFYRISTYHGTALAAHESSGALVHAGTDAHGTEWAQVYAFVPTNEKSVCLILPHRSDIGNLRIGEQEFPWAVPLRVVGRNANLLSFYNSKTGMYLCAAPIESGSGTGQVSLDRRKIGIWECFAGSELASRDVMPGPAELCSRFEEFLQTGLNAEALGRLLQAANTGAEWVPIIEVAAGFMSFQELQFVAEWILNHPSVLARLGGIYRNDPDAVLSLPRLREWICGRPGLAFSAGSDGRSVAEPDRNGNFPAIETVGADLDLLARRGFSGQEVSFPHVCNALLRRSIPPRRDVCIVATARNEGLYLLEWIAYHRLIGVQSFFLYTNDNSDGSDELIAGLHKAGVIVAIRNEARSGVPVQDKAYGHALGVLPDILDFRWVLFLDIDEFFTFVPNVFGSIQEYIAWQEVQPVDAIALNWIVLCSGGQVRWRDEPVTRRFDREDGDPARFVKTMSRPCLFIHSEPHFPVSIGRTPFAFRNSDRDEHNWAQTGTPALSDVPVVNHAWVNHYFYKSAQEFLWKWGRGRTDAVMAQLTNEAITPDFVRQFVHQHFASALAPPGRAAWAIRECAGDLEPEIARLMGLPGVSGAVERIKDRYRSRIDGITDMFASAPGILQAGEMGRRFAALLGRQTAGQAQSQY